MLGNEWRILLKDGTNIDGRPTQYSGVHGLLKYKGEFIFLMEDDGHFAEICKLTEEEIDKMFVHLSNLRDKFAFCRNYKVKFDTHLQMKRVISKDIRLVVTPRTGIAPIIDMNVKGFRVEFDANLLPGLVEVLDIRDPIKD